ncbi:hypothetical protein [Kitasatospora saccharophila]|uniref:hypothetical protein n=1 Tax=Kitasatospora saccharophila TaxID=407973 RepID=UPI0031D04E2F
MTALLGILLALAWITAGTGVTIGSAAEAAGIRAEHHQPELRMTLSDCRTTGRSRSWVHHCRGTGTPAAAVSPPAPGT